MLTALTLRNLAIVDSLDLELAPGMTVLTGETGAGKSILVDAIGLVLGDRTDNGMIRAGTDRAEITATFDISAIDNARAWLDERALAHDGECILRRVLVRDGRSRAFVNGSPLAISDLGAIGEHLLDIHGQHAHQSLTRAAYQRELLDDYGGHAGIAAETHRHYGQLRDIRRRIAELKAATAEQAARLDLLRFQVTELELLDAGADEWPALEQEHRRLSNAGAVREKCAALVDLLFEDDAVADRLEHAAALLDELATIDATLEDTRQMIRSALIEVHEARPALRDYADAIDLDPERLAALDERMGAIHRMARKYRVAPTELAQRLVELSAELASLNDPDATLAGLEAEEARALAAYRASAARLRKHRETAAERLSREITDSMQKLNMKGGRFSVVLTKADDAEPAPFGSESPQFQVTANAGQPEQPLARVASGGELSRISLAIQVAAAECSRIPTLIFDEVDVGIGGGVAEVVGRLLRRIGRQRQVLCVTHLPQVAAQADHQLRVEKHQDKGATRTLIEALDSDKRVDELARMLGGVKITPQTLAHAREMLQLAAS